MDWNISSDGKRNGTGYQDRLNNRKTNIKWQLNFQILRQNRCIGDVTNMVGYLATGELNIMIPPANLDTTYAVSTGNAGASPTISIQGTKPGQAHL